MSELEPCPFCGSNDIDPNGCASQLSEFGPLVTRPACDNCGATTDASWNTRAAPKVKALEWFTYADTHSSIGILGSSYSIDEIGGDYWLYENGDGHSIETLGSFDTLEAAKAAAQSHYEKLILETLE